MANTFTQIHVHFVFAVKYRLGMIQSEWEEELYKYITGISQNNNHKLLVINGMSDHIYIYIDWHKTFSIYLGFDERY